ncbi:MAG: integrase [Candidatus Binatia bacterium]
MSTMISEVYDALKEAGASEDKARKAAEAVASYDNRLARLETDVALVKWMLGFNLAMTVAILWKVFGG